MIKFFFRLIILVIAIAISLGLSIGLQLNAFLIAGIFICAWITIISLKDIFWWLITFSVLFSFMYYDTLGIYIISLMSISYLFDFVYMYTKRLGDNNILILYLISFGITFFLTILIELMQFHTILFSFKSMFVNIILTLVLFFLFRFFIKRVERFINLYTYGTDMRCHT